LARLARERPREPRHGVPVFSAVSVALAALILLLGGYFLVTRHGVPVALSYAIEGGHVERSGLIEAEPASEPLLRFSDGSEVHFAIGAKASLRHVDGRGARVALASGNAHVDVAHRPGAEWLFDAGPFQITVTGTAFTFGWTADDEQLDVRMERGSVRVSGPLTDGELALRSGQHLIVRVRRRETIIRELESDGSPEPAPAAGVAASQPAPSASIAPEAPAATESGLARPRRAAAGNGEWGARLARGDFEGIVQQAERRGVESCLAESSLADLAALADAARYGRHDDLARRALFAERRRFPVSGPSRDAAFLLGRLEETGSGPAAAIGWYDRYAMESPNGTYASESLGRKMILVQELRGDDEARGIAREYLSRFPAGTYATRARALAGP
jgi:TolA-binding protein